MRASGAVATGRRARLGGIVSCGADFFRLPAVVGGPPEVPGVTDGTRNPRNATVMGLLYAARGGAEIGGEGGTPAASREHGESWFGKIKEWLRDNF